MVECPACGDEFDTGRGMKAHHQSHDLPYYDSVVQERFGMSPTEFLEKFHREQKKTLEETAELIDGTAGAITQMAERHGVETLSPSEAKKAGWERMSEEERKQQVEAAHETTREMVERGEHNFQDEDFERVLTEEFLEEAAGCGHALYRTNYNGYEAWRARHDYDTDYVKVHRLLAVAEHGIEAVKGKHVHHKSGVPWDNRPGNIEIIDESEHGKLHYQERETDERGRFV